MHRNLFNPAASHQGRRTRSGIQAVALGVCILVAASAHAQTPAWDAVGDFSLANGQILIVQNLRQRSLNVP